MTEKEIIIGKVYKVGLWYMLFLEIKEDCAFSIVYSTHNFRIRKDVTTLIVLRSWLKIEENCVLR